MSASLRSGARAWGSPPDSSGQHPPPPRTWSTHPDPPKGPLAQAQAGQVVGLGAGLAVAQHQLAAVPQRKHSSSDGFFLALRGAPWPFSFSWSSCPSPPRTGVLTPATGTSAESPQGAGGRAGLLGPQGRRRMSVFLGTTTRRRAAPQGACPGPEGPHSGFENTAKLGKAGAGTHAAAPGLTPEGRPMPREAPLPPPGPCWHPREQAAAGITRLGRRPEEVGPQTRGGQRHGHGARPSRSPLTTLCPQLVA